jgi:glyoxylase-like metal-dependent hydrolase (beta-lactamase superfamily II)
VLRSQGRVIVVDTGAGNGRSRPNMPAFNDMNTDYLGALLRDAGITPEEVDIVVNTHLHGDHVGWNTVQRDGEYVPTFPNAKYLMPRADVEFWRPGGPRKSINAELMTNVFEDSIAPVLDAGQVIQWDEAYTIDDALKLELAPGHTPGMSVLKVESGNDRALLASDVFHTPLQVAECQLNSCFCEDADAARSSRGRLLRWAADRGALVLPAHFGGHSAFEVAEDAGRFSISSWASFGRL